MTKQRYYALLESSNGERFMYGSIVRPTVEELLWRYNNNWHTSPYYMADGWNEARTLVIETKEKIDGEWHVVNTRWFELPENIIEVSFSRPITTSDLVEIVEQREMTSATLIEDLGDHMRGEGIQI